MSLQAFRSERLSPPVGPFSQAIQAGEFLFLSGQVGQDPATGKLVDGGVEKQAEQIFANLAAVLEASGKSFSDVVKVGVFLTDMSDFQTLNAIYARHFEEPFPARTTVTVSALPLGAAVEVDLIAKA